MRLYITVSPTFVCRECGRKLVEVRDRPGTADHDLVCPGCDADRLEGHDFAAPARLKAVR